MVGYGNKVEERPSRAAVTSALHAVLGFAGCSRWSQDSVRADQREDYATRYTSHEVTAPRAAGPSGRTFASSYQTVSTKWEHHPTAPVM
jgi:hypothetical protein